MHSNKIDISNFQSSFIENSRKLLSPILNESGGILYSSGDTLKKGLIYILGLNPGGADGPTIEDSLNVIFSSKENAYLDEDWSTDKHKYKIGCHPLQKRIKYLSDYLGYNLRNICCSNLIFVRSLDQQGCNFDYNANLCWEVHKLIIDVICPKILLVFGNSKISPYFFVKTQHEKYFDNNISEDVKQSGHGNWSCRSFITNLFGNETLILGLPHLSRYRIIDYKNDRKIVLHWIKKKVNEAISKSV
ncbi:MAG TPA: hypothetical protein PLS49_08680 [Candidatus Woesebacteria bacterium]|nr:hypothetical protein [Candidatus Woesebacteria bacterium]